MKKLAMISILIGVIAVVVAGCSFGNSTKEQAELPIIVEDRDVDIKNIEIDDGVLDEDIEKEDEDKEDPEIDMILNLEGNTIQTRYNPPQGYTRIEVEENSFGGFLRSHKLKAYGEKALYYDGRSKRSEGVYDSVLEVEIGNRDLHQCADAIMLLRAEYLYSHQRYEEIQFNFVNGFLADYKNWMVGNRIQVDGNNTKWIPGGSQGTDYESFRKYMDMVFAYAGTLSLDEELNLVALENMSIGDVFIQGGSPGHAVIVVDMAKNNETGEKVFMLAQSYMPAQETQVLINPNDEIISPWYSLNIGNQLLTPEWKFDPTDLKGFE